MTFTYNMIAISIRDAIVDDVPGIQEVAQQSWAATYGDFLSDDTIDAVLNDWYARPQLEVPIAAEGIVYLVAATDDVIGFVSAAPTDHNEAQLFSLYVDPNQWNVGIGTDLLKAVTDRLKSSSVERLRVEVLADNQVGVAFFESQGFERTTEREVTLGERILSEYVYYRDL